MKQFLLFLWIAFPTSILALSIRVKELSGNFSPRKEINKKKVALRVEIHYRGINTPSAKKHKSGGNGWGAPRVLGSYGKL